MKVTKGHLTTAEKRVVKHFLENDLTEGRVKNKDYFITKKNGVYTVKIKVMDKGLIPCAGSKLRLSTYTHQFTL